MKNVSKRICQNICLSRWCIKILVLATPWWLQGCQSSRASIEPQRREVTLTSQDRVLILAPHPDDEVIGCGGIIQEAVAKKLPLRIVFFTYGDSNEWSFFIYRKRPVVTAEGAKRMGQVRHDEALVAAKVLGVSDKALTFFGYPDFGTLNIWTNHWGDRPPFRSMTTRAKAVPYTNALRPNAEYKGDEILQDLTMILREFRPTKVFVSHPTDHQPDHRALYLFTRVALWGLGKEMTPELYPYLVHFKRWSRPGGYHPGKPLKPPQELADQIPWAVYRLTPESMDKKRLALKAHRTQYNYSARYLLSFDRSTELFGDFPVVWLHPSTIPIPLSPKRADHPVEPSDELTDIERANFVGLESRHVHIEDGHLVLSIEFSRPLSEAVEASVYIFGYRGDRPFAQMPKIHIKLGMIHHAIYDQDRRLSAQAVKITRHLKRITIRVSLDTLGNPERILNSARTYLGEVPLDWASWRILELASKS